MKKIQVKICSGTTCFVMGANNLQELEEHLSDEARARVEITGAHCLGFCKDRNYGRAPFVEIDGEVLSGVNLPQLIAIIEEKVRNS